MRSHAKASSAGSSTRQGTGLGAIVRGAFAIRGASEGSGGIGAPSARRSAVLLSALTALAALMALSPATASAAPFHPSLGAFGSANQPSFNDARGIAIYQATGDVYVMDGGLTPSIKRYNADGTPDNFSALGTNAIDGEGGPDATPQEGLGFASPSESQIAVDNSGGPTDGDIYVTQNSPNAINVFSSAGAYLGQLTAAGATDFTEACGVAVDPSGAVYVGDYGSGIHKFVPAANPPVNADHTATFTTTSSPCTLAAGSGATAGFLFPAQYGGPISEIDSSTGELKYSFSEGVRTVSVDPVTGRVYAIKGSEFIEFDASGAASASAIASVTLDDEGRGIAVRGSSGNVYVSRFGTANLEVFGPLKFAPTVTIEPASAITATGATLNGTVDPEGLALSECKFQWGPTSASGYPNTAPCEQAVPTDSNPHAVSANISGLSAGGAEYRFRLVAKNADATEISDPETFDIGARIDGVAATAGSDEAILRGAIDPNGEATTYKFEWGPTGAYGNVTTPPGNLPAGDEPVAVEEALSGLSAGQTYHYRLVATNGKGTTTGPDQTFTPSITPLPLPQRGYEIASQYPTGGAAIVEIGGEATSEDGDRIAINAINPLAHSTIPPLPDDPASSLVGGHLQYVFSRGADSWQHRTEVGLGGESWSDDLQRLLTVTRTEAPGSGATYEDARVDPDDHNHSLDLYQWQADGDFVRISRDPRIAAGTPETAGGDADLANSVGSFSMSADGHTIVFKSRRQLLDSDTTVPDKFGESHFRLYKWEDGQLSFIGKRPDGSVPVEGSELGDAYELWSARYAVSGDGSRVVFSALRHDGVGGSSSSFAGTITTGAGIYVQTDGQPTVEATKEEGVPPLPAPEPYNITYRGAATDGSRVFFTSASRFTPDSGGGASREGATDLYVYDVGADKLRDLTPRSDGVDDPTVDPASADQARVLGVAANSEDGKRIYFVAEGKLPTAPNPEGDLPQASTPNLYLAELDSIDGPVKLRFIGTLGGGDVGDWQARWDENKSALATTDGTIFSFGSHKSLTGQPLGATQQLYVYDAEHGTLECPSCPSDGSLPVDGVNKFLRFGEEYAAFWQGPNELKRWMSSDGTVFFSTMTALLPADQNLVSDVYEFRQGQLQLVTTGTGTADATFTNASVDGSTAFINTRDALVPQDKEPGIPKIYAARVGGGFPYVPPGVPCDFNAGACEGAPTGAPQTPGAGTAAFEGPGNAKSKAARRCPEGKRKVRAKGKTRCVKPHNKKRHGANDKRNANNNRRAGR